VPFDRVPWFGGRGFQALGWLELTLLLVLVARLAISLGWWRRQLTITLFVVLLCIQGWLALLRASAPLEDVLHHLFLYLPFLVTVMWMSAAPRLDADSFLFWITMGIGVSGVVGLLANRVFPELLIVASRDQNLTEGLLGWGRLLWTGGWLVLFGWLGFIRSLRSSVSRQMLCGVAVIMAMAALVATVERTAILGVGGFVLSSMVLEFPRVRRQWRAVVVLALVCTVATVAMVLWSKGSASFGGLFETRVVKLVTSGAIDDVSLEVRRELFRGYWVALKGGFGLATGLGLGEPFVAATGSGVGYWADVSAMNFLLTFGLPGLACFFCFLLDLWHFATRVESRFLSRVTTKLLVLVSVMGSLNDNILCGKFFVVVLGSVLVSASHAEIRLPRQGLVARRGATVAEPAEEKL
jgi:hypothetical protein